MTDVRTRHWHGQGGSKCRRLCSSSLCCFVPPSRAAGRQTAAVHSEVRSAVHNAHHTVRCTGAQRRAQHSEVHNAMHSAPRGAPRTPHLARYTRHVPSVTVSFRIYCWRAAARVAEAPHCSGHSSWLFKYLDNKLIK